VSPKRRTAWFIWLLICLGSVYDGIRSAIVAFSSHNPPEVVSRVSQTLFSIVIFFLVPTAIGWIRRTESHTIPNVPTDLQIPTRKLKHVLTMAMLGMVGMIFTVGCTYNASVILVSLLLYRSLETAIGGLVGFCVCALLLAWSFRSIRHRAQLIATSEKLN
jgi:nitrate/nitrite transporter NarK